MALPETEEILTSETDITFRVWKKIFAIGADGADHVSIKANPRPRRTWSIATWLLARSQSGVEIPLNRISR